MAATKVQLIRDYGCGMGSFATVPETPAPETEPEPDASGTHDPQSTSEDKNQ